MRARHGCRQRRRRCISGQATPPSQRWSARHIREDYTLELGLYGSILVVPIAEHMQSGMMFSFQVDRDPEPAR